MITECPRCGGEVKGTGKTPLCQPCSTILSNRKRWSHRFPAGGFMHVKPRIKRHVTLPEIRR